MAMSGCCKEAWTPAEPAKVLEDGAGLVSSFRPIVLCLQLLGFDIHWGGRQLTDNRLISLFYRFIWLLINLTVVGTLTEHVHNIVSSYKGSSFEINRGIISATAIVQIIATYGSLTLAAWQDGGQLAESLRRIQARMPISKGMLKKIRIVSIVASAVATILPIALATAISIERYSANAFHFVIGLAWHFLCNIYLLLPASLLCILARTLSELLAEIRQDMELALADGQDVGPIVHVVAVRHSLVCQAVWRLDAFFSNVMLVTVACIFISSINYCFLIPVRLSMVNRNVTLAMAFSFAVALRFVVLDAIGYVAGCLKNKADSIHQCLIKSNLMHEGNAADQVMRLIVQVRLSPPKLTVGGYFEISRQLIPILISTTITYVLILRS